MNTLLIPSHPADPLLCSLEIEGQQHDSRGLHRLSAPQPSRRTRIRAHRGPVAFVEVIPICIGQKRVACAMSAKPSEGNRKPRGYWSIRANVVEALQTFAQKSSSPHAMPTASDLLGAGNADLLRAVQRNGGFAKIADLSGLLPNKRRRGFWSDAGPDGGLAYINREIHELQGTNKIEPGTLPSANKLRFLGRDDLVAAILRYGGFSKVAGALRLSSPPRGRPRVLSASATTERSIGQSLRQNDKHVRSERRKPPHYWNSWSFLKISLRQFALTHCEGHMPLQRELIDNGRSDLVNAIRIHGGFAHVARRAGLTPSLSVKFKRTKGYWTDPAVLRAELLTFMTKHGYPGVMPRRDQLLKAGRADIVYALQKHGGYSTIAADLHLAWHGPSNFWRVFRNLQRRVLAFLKMHGMSTMPSVEIFHDHGRIDLVHGIALHGGVMVVARRIGLDVKFPNRENVYWEEPNNVQLELEALIMRRPLETQRYMPSSVALVQAGRADLATAIRDHGGWAYYGQRLGLRFAFDVKGQGFWQREVNVLRELLSYVERRYGTWEFPGKSHQDGANRNRKRRKHTWVPCLEMLKRDGRSDIAFALERYHGGLEAFAETYVLRVANDIVSTMPAESLMKWSLFASELEEWAACYGSVGIMPTQRDLIRTGRNDLRLAMYKHGGIEAVSKRLQYVSSETSVDFWLPQWLGLQAGRLGTLIQICEKKAQSKMDRLLLKKLSRHLQRVTAKNVWKVRTAQGLVYEDSLVGKRYRQESHRRRKGSKRKRFGHAGKLSHKLSARELEALRERYEHLPPDDIIRI